MIYKYLRPIYSVSEGKEANFKVKDFNISVMLLGNLANVIVIFSRFIAGLDNDNNITFFNYSVVLLNALLTAVILNINKLVLSQLSIKNDIKIFSNSPLLLTFSTKNVVFLSVSLKLFIFTISDAEFIAESFMRFLDLLRE